MSFSDSDVHSTHEAAPIQNGDGSLAGVLHELAQPLMILCGLLDEASHAPDYATAMVVVQRARGECHRAIEVIHQLHALGAIDITSLPEGCS